MSLNRWNALGTLLLSAALLAGCAGQPAQPVSAAPTVALPTATPRPTRSAATAQPQPPTAVKQLVPATAAPAPPTAPPAPTTPFPSAAFAVALDQSGGTATAIVFDTVSGQPVYDRNAATQVTAASLIKVPIVMAVFQLARQGALSLDELLTLREEDKVGGTGIIQGQPAGGNYAIRDLCELMLRDSDNTAGNMILQRVGLATINATIAGFGTPQTQVQRLFLDEAARKAGRENLTSAADMAHLLRLLNDGSLLGADFSAEIITALTRSSDQTRVRAGVPAEVPVAHKTGNLAGFVHDAALIQLPKRPLIVVVLLRDVADAAGNAAIAAAARVAYDYAASQ